MDPNYSETPAVPGRVVHVYGVGRYPMEPLPALVTRAWANTPHVNLAVFADTNNTGTEKIEELYSVGLFDPLTPEQRRAVHARQIAQPWCEWLPFQKGQVTQQFADKLVGEIAELKARVAMLEKARLDVCSN